MTFEIFLLPNCHHLILRHLYHNLVTVYMVRYYHYLDRVIELSPTITTHTNEIHAYEMHAHEMYAYEVHAIRCMQMRCMPMRNTPVRRTP